MLLNRRVQPEAVIAGQIRTGIGTYTEDPAPPLAVQLEVTVTFASDPEGVLWRQVEALRYDLSVAVLDWFDDGPQLGLCEMADIRTVRVSVLGLGEEHVFELEPLRRILVDGEGGDTNFIAANRGRMIPPGTTS